MSEKLKDVMAYLLKRHKNRLSNTAMNDLAYQADLYHVKDHGQQIMKTKWRRSKRDEGPFVLDFQKTAEDHGDIFNLDEESVATPNYAGTERIFSLKDETFEPHLSDEAKKSLDDAIETARKFGRSFHAHVQRTSPLRNAAPRQDLNLLERAKE